MKADYTEIAYSSVAQCENDRIEEILGERQVNAECKMYVTNIPK